MATRPALDAHGGLVAGLLGALLAVAATAALLSYWSIRADDENAPFLVHYEVPLVVEHVEGSYTRGLLAGDRCVLWLDGVGYPATLPDDLGVEPLPADGRLDPPRDAPSMPGYIRTFGIDCAGRIISSFQKEGGSRLIQMYPVRFIGAPHDVTDVQAWGAAWESCSSEGVSVDTRARRVVVENSDMGDASSITFATAGASTVRTDD